MLKILSAAQENSQIYYTWPLMRDQIENYVVTYPEVKLRFLRIMLAFVLLVLFHMLRIEF